MKAIFNYRSQIMVNHFNKFFLLNKQFYFINYFFKVIIKKIFYRQSKRYNF